MNIQGIIKKISSYEYVSFDIFDTVLKRNVKSPSQIFDLVKYHFEKENEYKLGDFKSIRKNAEALARENSGKEDIDIDCIYSFINEWDETVVSELKRLEQEIESNILLPSQWMKPVYEYCKANNKKIIFISDMYLSKGYLLNLLKSKGFDCYKLYVSSDIGLVKSTGHLFDYVLKDLNIKPKEIIHIGDAKKSDFLIPRLKGMNSIRIPYHIDQLNYYNPEALTAEQLFAYNNVSRFINNNINLKESMYHNVGYEVFGVLLYAFSKWLMEDLKKENISKVFFFSRDGLILKKAFEMVDTAKEFNSTYFYVSRRSLTVPLLWLYHELDNLHENITITRYFSVDTFLRRLGLEPQSYVDIIEGEGLSLDTLLNKDTFQKDSKVIALYSKLKEDVISNSKKEFELLVQYLKENGFEGDIAIVDIGWRGSMQKAIKKVAEAAGIKVNIQGYYMGLDKEIEGQKGKGFIHNYDTADDLKVRLAAFFGLFETFFLASHGSVEKYQLVDNKVEAVLMKSEYDDEKGNPSIYSNYVKEIHEGALKFIENYRNQRYLNILPIDSETAFRNMFTLGTSPKLSDIHKFKEFPFMDTEYSKLVNAKSAIYYLFHPKKFIQDYFKSVWKIGFLKDVFKINIPYFKVYNLLKKIVKK